MDLAALGFALGGSTRRTAVAGALGFVAGATALDIWSARGLDRTTGEHSPKLNALLPEPRVWRSPTQHSS